MKEFELTAEDGLHLSCARYEAAAEAIGSLMIVHGAKGDKSRYDQFAEFFSRAGYHVTLFDLRGHGKSVSSSNPQGYMGSLDLMISDLLTVSTYVRRQDDLPLFVFAHSFGSVLARCFLQKHDALLHGLILSGTVRSMPSALIAVPAAKLITRFSGRRGHNPLLMRLGDPDSDYSSYQFCNASIVTNWSAIRELACADHFTCQNPSLPILSVSGALDPVTGGGKGVQRTVELLHSYGYSNVRSLVYEKMPHSLIHAPGKERVWRDIEDFLSVSCARTPSSIPDSKR